VLWVVLLLLLLLVVVVGVVVVVVVVVVFLRDKLLCNTKNAVQFGVESTDWWLLL
jgi:hypothetical protein